MLLRPLKANDDGSGRDIALWNHMERGVEEMQGVASRFDSLAQLPPPPSYSLLVSRFLLLWSATLPFTMLSVLPRWCVPPCKFLVAWALYSTEELAQLMEEPCGNPRKPETLPLEQVCESLVMQLKQQVILQRRVQQRVDDRTWVVEPEDLEGVPSAYIRKDSLAFDDSLETSATDSPDDEE
eukprot:Transcript_8280.p2 GENE.Transcript_8280~~Transcript_8280.p2  ORF type:complete len:182 (+),score=74.58 Transcript_8280:793-1338(+)